MSFFANAFKQKPASLSVTLAVANALMRNDEPQQALNFIRSHAKTKTIDTYTRALNSCSARGTNGMECVPKDTESQAYQGEQETSQRNVDVRLAVVQGFVHAAAGDHGQAARLFLPAERIVRGSVAMRFVLPGKRRRLLPSAASQASSIAAFEELLGVPRRVRMAAALLRSLVALGQHVRITSCRLLD